VVGPDADKIAKELMLLDLPNTLLAYSTTLSDVPLMKDRYNKAHTKIFVCERGVCQLPVDTIPEALKIIKK
jgi:uncharacterized protein YyaL (SSP411 family)